MARPPVLDVDDIARLVVTKTRNVDWAATWVAVILAESGGDPVAYNLVDHDPKSSAYLSTDNGLFQINSFWHGQRLRVHEANRPELAWDYAWDLATANGTRPPDWSPWTAYRNGAWLGEVDRGDGTVEHSRLDTAYHAVLELLDSSGDTMTRYPYGYDTGTMGMTDLRGRFEPKMHPEFARRLFAWLESEGGMIGIGSGWRQTQPAKPGFAPDGRSFHQTQTWASGFKGYAAVDLVVKREVGKHRAPTWPETESAKRFGLHTFIKTPPEPWHLQPVETRGWSTWVAAGRPDPDPEFRLPTDQPDPTPPPVGDDFMIRFRHTDFADQFAVGASGALHMTPTAIAIPEFAELRLVENTDREFLVHCCNAAGFDFARLTSIK